MSSPFSLSLGCLSASKFGCIYFESHALHTTGGRVRECVDMVGRLGNASRRESTLAYDVPRRRKRALQKHLERSHQQALTNGMPADVTLLEHINISVIH
ncbi:hypothetical protein TNCV_3601461 [Trichonephila clavipes]|nr:hypothetical protein TNCV_3601461 [Trichonephila clavipes]